MTNEITVDNYAVSLQWTETIKSVYNGNRNDTDLINSLVFTAARKVSQTGENLINQDSFKKL